jgi:hypothetical protein
LEVEEAVEVPAPGRPVVGPRLGLLAGKDDALPPVGGFGIAPDQQPDAPLAGLHDELGEVAQRAQSRVNAVVVGDVVTVVAQRRGVDGIEPQAGDAEPAQVVEAADEPGRSPQPSPFESWNEATSTQ